MRFLIVALFCGCVLLAGCTKKDSSAPNATQIRQKTADATATLKRDATAVAQGVSEGLNRDKKVDLNSASKDQLVTLPGMTPAKADVIMQSRPYSAPQELVTKHILTRAEYDKIANRVVANRQ
jgi:DNA uptake protein ComE-like DNA-binding protein